MKYIGYLSILLLHCGLSYNLQAQSIAEVLVKDSWASSKPIEVLEKPDILILTQKSGIAYGWLEFLSDSAIMISQSQHYCERMRNGSYSSGTYYRWYKCGTWFLEGDSIELILAQHTVFCKIVSASGLQIKLLVTSVAQH